MWPVNPGGYFSQFCALGKGWGVPHAACAVGIKWPCGTGATDAAKDRRTHATDAAHVVWDMGERCIQPVQPAWLGVGPSGGRGTIGEACTVGGISGGGRRGVTIACSGLSEMQPLAPLTNMFKLWNSILLLSNLRFSSLMSSFRPSALFNLVWFN